jgi:hypothetical protein
MTEQYIRNKETEKERKKHVNTCELNARKPTIIESHVGKLMTRYLSSPSAEKMVTSSIINSKSRLYYLV